MELTTLVGVVAGILTTSSFVPQVVKTWKTRHTKDLSLFMFFMLLAGIALWLTYGIVRRDIPIILANGVSLMFVVIILSFKIRYG